MRFARKNASFRSRVLRRLTYWHSIANGYKLSQHRDYHAIGIMDIFRVKSHAQTRLLRVR